MYQGVCCFYWYSNYYLFFVSFLYPFWRVLKKQSSDPVLLNKFSRLSFINFILDGVLLSTEGMEDMFDLCRYFPCRCLRSAEAERDQGQVVSFFNFLEVYCSYPIQLNSLFAICPFRIPFYGSYSEMDPVVIAAEGVERFRKVILFFFKGNSLL